MSVTSSSSRFSDSFELYLSTFYRPRSVRSFVFRAARAQKLRVIPEGELLLLPHVRAFFSFFLFFPFFLFFFSLFFSHFLRSFPFFFFFFPFFSCFFSFSSCFPVFSSVCPVVFIFFQVSPFLRFSVSPFLRFSVSPFSFLLSPFSFLFCFLFLFDCSLSPVRGTVVRSKTSTQQTANQGMGWLSTARIPPSRGTELAHVSDRVP